MVKHLLLIVALVVIPRVVWACTVIPAPTPATNVAAPSVTFTTISAPALNTYDLNCGYVEYVIVGSTGQSLSVGGGAGTPNPENTTQPYSNVELYDSLGLDAGYQLAYPEAGTLSLQPLVAPERPTTNYNGYNPYPSNIGGETVDVAALNEITALAAAYGITPYNLAASNVGQGGKDMSVIQKNGSGPSYAASLFEARAIQRLSTRPVMVGAMFLTHGENDANLLNTSYGTQVATLQQNYQTDFQAITGQTPGVPLIMSQMHSEPPVGSAENLISEQMLLTALAHPGSVVLSGPKYQYPMNSDNLHMPAASYAAVGEKYAEVYFRQVIQVRNWLPIYPTSISRSGTTVTITFHMPVGLNASTAADITSSQQLVFDTNITNPNQIGTYSLWAAGNGLEAFDGTTPLGITASSIVGTNQVRLTLASTPSGTLTIAYAHTASNNGSGVSIRIGRLRDSDPFVGRHGSPNYNWCVEFSQTVPYP
jgi:Carbohydrate esterase, sialic acid-specific acetylesterase